MRRYSCGSFVSLLLILFLLVNGCGVDVDPVTPQTGTVVVACQPDDQPLPWSLVFPDGTSAVGFSDSTLSNVVEGQYTISWGIVEGWNRPNPDHSTKILTAGYLITFSGTYTEIYAPEGTIVIDSTPNSLDAPWNLAGPDGYTLADIGDTTLTNMAIGNYTLTWGEIAGFLLPEPNSAALTLVEYGEETFSGTYVENPGMADGFVLVPPVSVSMPATFTMGDAGDISAPPHQVTLTGSFYMAETEVTNGQYAAAVQWAYDQGYVTVAAATVRDAVYGSTAPLLDLEGNYSKIDFSDGVFSTSYPDLPVACVSWFGSAAYCDWLSLQEGLPQAYDHNIMTSNWSCNSGDPYGAGGYRLPTEAEWEFACRAGTTTRFSTGDCLDAETEANYAGNQPYPGCPPGPFLGSSMNVRSYPANAWGLFEMHGNKYEWCHDWYGDYGTNETNPVGIAPENYRVSRGGNWWLGARACSSFTRNYAHPSHSEVGSFRPVRSTH